jgi:transcriptional regulator with XRE-family HTH domain
MTKTFSSDLEKMDKLLHKLGGQGVLDIELNEEDLDRLLAAAPRVSLSISFSKRAQAAMTDAQNRRERRDPAIGLGRAVGRARSRTGLGLAELADQARVSVRSLEALEAGQLSVGQILRHFPPAAVTQMLEAIGLAIDEFTDWLMDLAAVGRRPPMAIAARTTDRQQHRDTANLVIEVTDYIAVVRRMAQSKKSRGQ